MNMAWNELDRTKKLGIVAKLENIRNICQQLSDLQVSEAKSKAEALQKTLDAKIKFNEVKARRNDLDKENDKRTITS